ncbi:uncharacterized protein TNCV_713901 [Trichonephila clavipes]|nr:uncharacterized protein TNCV_713901 [Trichonephila clavipes]
MRTHLESLSRLDHESTFPNPPLPKTGVLATMLDGLFWFTISEFERGLIIGMKTAGWSTRRVAGQGDRSECAVRNCWQQWTREGTHERKTGSGATRKTRRREDQRIVRQALVDSTVTRSTIRADIGVAIVPQTISRHLAEANLKSTRAFSVHSL